MIGTTDSGRWFRPSSALVLLFLLASALGSCGTQTSATPAASPPPPINQEPSEVLILPPGRAIERQSEYWTMESQRLVLAYFDIFMRHGFQYRTSSAVSVGEEGYEPVGLEFDDRELECGNGPVWSAFAPERGRLAYGGRYPDYVLLFDALRFGILKGGGSRQSYDTPGAGKVELDLGYILWDNEAQEIAACGLLHEQMYTNSPHASSQAFKDLFEKMIDRVVQETPITP